MLPIIPILIAVAAGVAVAEVASSIEEDDSAAGPGGGDKVTRSVLLLGDSLAQGLTAPLGAIAKSHGLSFVAHGVSGTRADQWAGGSGGTSLDRDIASIDSGTIALVSLGTNDFKAGKQTVRAAAQSIVGKIRAKGADLIWILPPEMPFSDLGVRAALEGELASLNVRAYPSQSIEIARAGDGIHATPAGYSTWADAIAAWIPLAPASSSSSTSSPASGASPAPETPSQKNLGTGSSSTGASVLDRLRKALSSSGSSLVSKVGADGTVADAGTGEQLPIADLPDNAPVGHYLLQAWNGGRVDSIVWKQIQIGPFAVKVASFPMTVQGYAIPSSARDQYEICKISNLMMPTKEIVDAMHTQADRKLIAITEPVEHMATWRAVKEWNAKLQKEIGDRDPGQLIHGAWKHWILITPSGSGAVNYGFCKTEECADNPSGRWQGPGRAHDLDHLDYSQLFQPVWPEVVRVDTGERFDLRDYIAVAHAPNEVPGSTGRELLSGPPIDPKWIAMMRG